MGSNTDNDYVWKNFTPRQNPPVVKTAESAANALPTPLAGLSPAEVDARIDAMTVEELKAAVRRYMAVQGDILLLTKEETAQAMLDTLAATALRPVRTDNNLWADLQQRMAAIDKWLDREKGKPKASLDVTGKIGIIDLVMGMPSYNKIENGKTIEN